MHHGEEFRDDASKRLPAQVLQPLTKLSAWRSSLAIMHTVISLAAVISVASWLWTPWILIPAVLLIGTLQHALFILAHDAAHYRLYESRWWNDAIGCSLGIAGGISMRTYRVIHRLHHNHLYGPQDPDVALHGGYPRGRAYLLKKLAKDLLGLTAWKNYSYFFGNPAINAETGESRRPLNDTSQRLRTQARQDRWVVVFVHAAMLAAAFLGGFLVPYLVLWLLPMLTVLQAILRLRAICEHGAVSDTTTPLKSARTNQAPWFIRSLLFPHHVNYHLDHHLYPAVPHYNLPGLHRALQLHGFLQEAEVRSLAQTFRLIFSARLQLIP
ncbi:MAG: fatty acid desaturase family protein [Burkholderiales bacterium]